MKLLRSILVLVVLGLGCVFAFFVAIGRADLRGAHESAVKSSLRNLAQVQEAYFEEHQRYAAELAVLEYVSSSGVTVEMKGDGDGWAATAHFHNDGFLLGFDIDCATLAGPLGVPSWGEVDMTRMASGQLRCADDEP